MTARVAVLVLAAGRGRRFGSGVTKLVTRVSGVPLVRTVVNTAVRSGASPVVVVTGHDRERVEAALDGVSVRFVNNADFRTGLASSLKCGLAALPGDIDGVLVLLADMPAVKTETLAKLIAQFAGQAETFDAVVPVFAGERGNPALIGRRLFAALGRLEGDAGARSLLSSPDLVVVSCAVDDPGISIDVDTIDDLQKL